MNTATRIHALPLLALLLCSITALAGHSDGCDRDGRGADDHEPQTACAPLRPIYTAVGNTRMTDDVSTPLPVRVEVLPLRD